MAKSLEKEMEIRRKREARKKDYEDKKKTKKDKMEVILEQVMAEPNLEARIIGMEDELEMLEGQKPRARGNSKEEYENNLAKASKQLEERKRALQNKLRFYKAFKEHRKEILNIREYRDIKQNKLEELEGKRKVIISQAKEILSVNEEEKKLENELEELKEKKSAVELKIKKLDLSDEEKQKLESELGKIKAQISENNDKYSKNEQKKQKLKETANKNEILNPEKLEAQIARLNIEVSNANTIWNCLLKGKNWDEIQAILTQGKFTGEKGTTDKMRNLKEKSELGKDVGEKDIQAQIAKNVQKIINEKENCSKETGAKEIEKEGAETEKDSKGKDLPVPAEKSFKEAHPRLAKIPGLSWIAEKVYNRNQAKKTQNTTEVESKEDTEKLDNVEEKKEDTEKLDNAEEKVEFYKNVAEKGYKEALKVSRETQRKLAETAHKARMEEEATKRNEARYQRKVQKREEKKAKLAGENIERG